ncbi:MAG: hypothetical protein ACREON_00565 [Gemmatimonadaceae bacterium]
MKVDRPDDWFWSTKCVPTLRVPRELFGLSNRPITPVPDELEQSRPMIADLDAGAVFVWCYYQAPDDPDPVSPDRTPDYSRYAFPLRYAEAEVFPGFDAREWKSSDFIWRRLGFHTGVIAVSVFVWEGTGASYEDIKTVQEVTASVALA